MEGLNPLRICRECELKALNQGDLELFVPHKLSPHGRQNYCKKCRVKYQIEYRKKHPDLNKKYKKSFVRRTKEKVISLYGGQCVCCGEKILEFLTMDHIRNDGKAEREKFGRGSKGMYQHMINQYYEDPKTARQRYQPLCFNCNWGRQISKGTCPHKNLKERKNDYLKITDLMNEKIKILDNMRFNESERLKTLEEIKDIEEKIQTIRKNI